MNASSADAPTASASVVATLAKFERRTHLPKLIIAAVLSMIVGALLGGVAFSLRAPDVTATALIRVTQPIDLAAVASGASYSTPDAQPVTESYAAGEVAYMMGEGFAKSVADIAGDTSVTAEQAGGSSVVTLTSIAKSEDDATGAVQAAIDVYGKTLKQRADMQLRTVLPTLDRWQAADALDPIRVAQIARIRDAVLVLAQNADAVTVLQPPTVDTQPLGQWPTGAALGAVGLGGLVVWLMIARRRRRPTLVAQVAEIAHNLLIPPVNVHQPARPTWGPAQVSLARTLSAQLGATDAERVIATVGIAPQSGTDVVAALLDVAAADHAAGKTSGSSVIDAGPVGGAPLADSAIGQATHIVAVLRIDADKPADVLPALSALKGYGVPVSAAFTYRPLWPLGKKQGPDQPQRGGHRRSS